MVSVPHNRFWIKNPKAAVRPLQVKACFFHSRASERAVWLNRMVELARGISAKGRSKSYKKRGLHFIKEKNGGKFPQHAKKEKAAEAPAKASKFYPAGESRGIAHPISKAAPSSPGLTPLTLPR